MTPLAVPIRSDGLHNKYPVFRPNFAVGDVGLREERRLRPRALLRAGEHLGEHEVVHVRPARHLHEGVGVLGANFGDEINLDLGAALLGLARHLEGGEYASAPTELLG